MKESWTALGCGGDDVHPKGCEEEGVAVLFFAPQDCNLLGAQGCGWLDRVEMWVVR